LELRLSVNVSFCLHAKIPFKDGRGWEPEDIGEGVKTRLGGPRGEGWLGLVNLGPVIYNKFQSKIILKNGIFTQKSNFSKFKPIKFLC
jgi:hypothetical protein